MILRDPRALSNSKHSVSTYKTTKSFSNWTRPTSTAMAAFACLVVRVLRGASLVKSDVLFLKISSHNQSFLFLSADAPLLPMP